MTSACYLFFALHSFVMYVKILFCNSFFFGGEYILINHNRSLHHPQFFAFGSSFLYM